MSKSLNSFLTGMLDTSNLHSMAVAVGHQKRNAPPLREDYSGGKRFNSNALTDAHLTYPWVPR